VIVALLSVRAIALVVAWTTGGCSIIGVPISSEEIGTSIRDALEGKTSPAGIVQTELTLPSAVHELYGGRDFRPLWVTPSALSASGQRLVEWIDASENEGLDPEDYHRSRLVHLNEGAWSLRRSPNVIAELDLLLSDAFLVAFQHQNGGRFDPHTLRRRNLAAEPNAKLLAPLAMISGFEERQAIESAVEALFIDRADYRPLAALLSRYRMIAAHDGWVRVPEGPRLALGMSDARVPLLRARLAAEDLKVSSSTSERFDEAIEESVSRFQDRFDLEPTGTVDEQTLAAINTPVEARIRLLEMNLERRRWLVPGDRRFVIVNIAGFVLSVEDRLRPRWSMRVVVGRTYRKTPLFDSRITHMVLNPAWAVPNQLAVKDILPLVKKDPGYLEKKRFHVLGKGAGGATEELDPVKIDWSSVTAESFVYRLRQDPGPQNALGRIKFVIPNPYDVYLHDTPAKELFRKRERTMSAGCIRLEKPLALAEIATLGMSWTKETLEAEIATRKSVVIRLRNPLEVHLVYWTVWEDESGVVHFERDPYGNDAALSRAWGDLSS
jgi:L,D-transpeptidase YcbB